MEGWRILGETTRQIRITKKVSLGSQQVQNPCVVDLFIHRTRLFSLSSALALSSHSFSEKQRANASVCLCHLVSNFSLKRLSDTIFVVGCLGFLNTLWSDLLKTRAYSACILIPVLMYILHSFGEKKILLPTLLVESVKLKYYATLKF